LDRYYEITRASLSSVWPAVKTVADALLQREELDRDELEEFLFSVDVFTPVLRVQQENWLPLAASCGRL
jgi:hypothetical protein